MCDHTRARKLLFSESDAALAITYRAGALDYAIASGELPVIRRGAHVLISREALEASASKVGSRMTPLGGQTARNAAIHERVVPAEAESAESGFPVTVGGGQ